MPLLFIQEGPPNTISYLILGYAIMGAIGLGYVISLVLRQRGLQRDLDVVERLRRGDDE